MSLNDPIEPRLADGRGLLRALTAAAVLATVAGGVTTAEAACSTRWDNTAHYHEGTGDPDTCNGDDHSTGHNEYFYTYAENDTVNAAGSASTHGDIIESMGGHDVVDGQGGYDNIRAGEQCDTVRGGSWGDLIHMGDSVSCGSDDAYGDDGNDEIHGSWNSDSLRGSAGVDRIYDDCCGGDGEKDRVCGGADAVDYATTMDGDTSDIIYGDVEQPSADQYDGVTSFACQL